MALCRIIGLCAAAILLLTVRAALADPAPFDLVGPTLAVSVTRGTVTLPITKVPNLVAGDRLQLQVELPQSQSTHYLMVAAFLRGPTNPPPADWFYRCDTWTKSCRQGGQSLTVPPDAEQLLVLFAPETGGDYKTLVNAVQGRPGAFVRAAQELNQAALDRSRLDQYLLALRELDSRDPAKVKEAAPLLARSLAIKVDEKCLDRIPALQAPCLMQGGDALILSDGHDASMVATLTSGPASDLAIQAGSTALMNSGAYLPYIGSILDIARLMDSFHTAKYQYIPALASRQGEKLVLMLNTPPSFHDPKSVLVAALPPVEPFQAPPLHNADVKAVYCAQRKPLVLAVDGAPLVFATDFAHDMTLEAVRRDGKSIALHARPDAQMGGLLVDSATLAGSEIDEKRGATLHGYWGFAKFDGPTFQLANAATRSWAVAPGDEAALVVGRDDTVHLVSGGAACLEDIRLRDLDGQETKLAWKVAKPDRVEVKVPLTGARPGERAILIKQYGIAEPQVLHVSAYASASRLDGFELHAGDAAGTLKGTRLDEIESLTIKGLDFVPGAILTAAGNDELRLTARDQAAAATLKAGETGPATVTLKDGRTLTLDVAIAASRPRGVLLAKNRLRAVAPVAPVGPTFDLANADELPLDARFTFTVKAVSPATFSRNEAIEIASSDESFSTTLSVSHGGLTLANSRIAIATLDPAAAFGTSAFGPLRFRLIANGVAGDWQPLGVLVRLPDLKEVVCPATTDGPCELTGANLYLVDSVAADSEFRFPVQVAEGFAADSMPVPHPIDQRLYIRLRDDPSVINTARVPTSVPPDPASSPKSGVAAAPPGPGPTPQADPVAGTADQTVPTPSDALPLLATPGPSAQNHESSPR